MLPQIVYYVSAYCDLLRDEKIAAGQQINVCVPTGNFGNILAAYYAREMGVPIHQADLRLQPQQRPHRLPEHRRVRPQPALL